MENPVMTHVRETDDPVNPFRITRGVPAWGLILLFLSIAGGATAQFYGQKENVAAISRLEQTVAAFDIRMRAFTDELVSKNLQLQKHDMLLNEYQRRILELEARTWKK